MNGRIYDPQIGRFLSADTEIDGIVTLQGWNRYSYLKNNPLNGTDPTGNNKYYQSPLGGYTPTQKQLTETTKSMVAGSMRSGGKGVAFVASAIFLSDDEMVVANADRAGMTPEAYKADFVGDMMEAVDDIVTEVTGVAPDDPISQLSEVYTDLAGVGTGAAAITKTVTRSIDDFAESVARLADDSVQSKMVDDVPVANNNANRPNLHKQLASEEQVGQLTSGQGQPMAGAGTNKEIRDSARLAATYGGKAEDWSKIKSTTRKQDVGYGSKIETHAYENKSTDQVVELKTKLKEDTEL